MGLGKKMSEIEKALNFLTTKLEIAQKNNAEIYIINVNPEKSIAGLAKKEVDEIMHDCNLNCQFLEKTGTPYKEILQMEKELNADLIIMGTHGSGDRDPNWIGGNAFKVLSGSICPVITVTGMAPHIGFKNIVLPIADASETRQKVPFTIALAKLYNAKVHIAIMHKNEDQEVINTLKIYAAQAEGFCIENGVEYTYKEIYKKNIADACTDYADEIDADLIAIMSEREADTGFFMGHYAQKLLNKTNRSVLTVHIKDTAIVGGSGY